MDSLKHQVPQPRDRRPRRLLVILSALTMLCFLLSLLFEPFLKLLHARDFALLALAILFVLLADGREGGKKPLAALPLLCAVLACTPDLFDLLGDHLLLHIMPGKLLYVMMAACFVLLAVWCLNQSDNILRAARGLSLALSGIWLFLLFLTGFNVIGSGLPASFFLKEALPSLFMAMLNTLLAVFCRGKLPGTRTAPP